MNYLEASLDKILTSGREQLRSHHYVEHLIQFAGLHYDKRPLYGDDTCFMRSTGGVYQIPTQFARALIRLSTESIVSICDIGSLNGWATVLLCAYLSVFNDKISCTSLDSKSGNLDNDAVSLVHQYGLDVSFVRATSNAFANNKWDLSIIDGSHTWQWVSTDYKNVGVNSKLCWFHDVNDAWCPDVKRFYTMICRDIPHEEFLEHPNGWNVMGIGIICDYNHKLFL